MSNRFFADKIYEESGIFGIYAPGEDVAQLTYYGLLALQHRGQDGAGIAVSDGKKLQHYKNKGLVTKVLNNACLEPLKGNLAIGHVDHAVLNNDAVINVQPIDSSLKRSRVSLVHDGKIINSLELRRILSALDSNLDLIKRSLKKIKGTYSMIMLTENQLLALRDPQGVKPLSLGKLGGGYVLASESCAFDIIGAQFIRDLRPGELVIIDSDGLKSIEISTSSQHNLCSFEYIYFARQDSVIEGSLVNSVRRSLGRQLAFECRIDADLVVPVPDSGVAAASGYAKQSSIPLKEGLIKNRYVGRTLIQAHQRLKEQAINLKYNPVKDVVKGRKVVLVDDSIISGKTTGHIVKLLRAAGVKEVHLLVGSPAFLYPCYYGMDFTGSNQLIAAWHSLAEIKKYLGVDGLHYLSLEGLMEALKPYRNEVCTTCFTGDCLIEFPLAFNIK